MGPAPAPRRALTTVVGVLVVLSACAPGRGGGAAAAAPGAATVVTVVDGDTIEVEVGGATETVRLLGVDTPETVDPDEPVGCFGPEASARTTALLPPGTEVRLERDEEARDRFGRLLAYVHRSEDGLFVNQALLQDGYAETLIIEPNHAYAGELLAAQDQARAGGAGLWSACG